jgi:hypothetical protein
MKTFRVLLGLFAISLTLGGALRRAFFSFARPVSFNPRCHFELRLFSESIPPFPRTLSG